MTRGKDFKRLVRERAATSGVRYTAARNALLRKRKEAGMVPVTCEVRTTRLSAEELSALRKREELAATEVREKYPDTEIKVKSSSPEVAPVLLLKEVGGERFVAIMCGRVEATAIALAQQGVETDDR